MGKLRRQTSKPKVYKSLESFERQQRIATQNYIILKQKCREDGRLFEDELFLANNDSFFSTQALRRAASKRKTGKSANDLGIEIEWKRPHELKPSGEKDEQQSLKFIYFDEVTSQPKNNWTLGKLGNHWLLGVVATLLSAKGATQLIQQIAPTQTFDKDDYFGIFRFRIWYFGKWHQIVVDDRLPTYKGQLLMAHDPQLVQWWVPLLEKAYAKLVGGYEPLGGSYLSEGMADFTAGGCESYKLEQLSITPDEMFAALFKAVQRESLICAYIEPKDLKQRRREISAIGGQMKNMSTHAFYSVTALNWIDFEHETTPRQLLRLRNLQGKEIFWQGAWSPTSDEWNNVPPAQREQFGLVLDYESEFWMCMDDFLNVFTRMDMCHLCEFRFPSAIDLAPTIPRKQTRNKFYWTSSCRLGRWEQGITDGGCGMNQETFHKNPRYLLELSEVFIDKEDESSMVSAVAFLMQTHRSSKRTKGVFDLKIGVAVYSVSQQVIASQRGKLRDTVPIRRAGELYPITPEDILLPQDFFARTKPIVRSRFFINQREVSLRMRIPVGAYLLIPCTFDRGQVGNFLLRLFVEKADFNLQLDSALEYLSNRNKSDAEEAPELPTAVGKAVSIAKIGSSLFKQNPSTTDDLLNACKLHGMLNQNMMAPASHLSLDQCRMLLLIYDDSRTGVLSPDKFDKLVDDLKRCHAAFTSNMDDVKPQLVVDNLKSALDSMAIKDMPPETIDMIAARYAHFQPETGKPFFYFGYFCCAALRLRHALDAWKKKTHFPTATASFTINDFIGHVFLS